MQFTKLFNSILDSTIWQEPPATKLVWITLLAMADRNGDVHASIPGLAKRAGVTLDECESALQCLSSPDKYSRTKDHEGRRIRAMDGGFTLLNHGKYRALLSAEERKEYNRKKQAEYRASKSLSKNVNDSQSLSAKCTHTEAEAEAEAEAKKNTTTVGLTLTADPAKPSRKTLMADDAAWLTELAKNPAYRGLNLETELGKMQAWCQLKRKLPSRARFLNWINNAITNERPMQANRPQPDRHAAYTPAGAMAKLKPGQSPQDF